MPVLKSGKTQANNLIYARGAGLGGVPSPLTTSLTATLTAERATPGWTKPHPATPGLLCLNTLRNRKALEATCWSLGPRIRNAEVASSSLARGTISFKGLADAASGRQGPNV